jgi:MarR family transcriptional regulator, organic hydroperoxide resistance regulator
LCLNNNSVDLNNSYGFILMNFLKKNTKRFDNALKKYSIVTNHYRVLVTVYNTKHINQKKLGEILKIDRTTMVHLIDHLENEGYIKRQKNHEDRRSFQLILTDKGNAIINPICKIRDEIQNKSLKEATENEKRIFREIYEKIENN